MDVTIRYVKNEEKEAEKLVRSIHFVSSIQCHVDMMCTTPPEDQNEPCTGCRFIAGFDDCNADENDEVPPYCPR
jgi:hypothetical protein